MSGRESSTHDGTESMPVGAVTADGEVVTSQSDDDDGQGLLPSTWRGKAWAVVVALGLGFGATVLSTLLVVGFLLGLGALAIPLPSSQLVRFGIQFFFGQVLVMGGLSAAYLWATGKSVAYVKIRRPTDPQVAVIVVGPFVVFVVNIVVNIAGFAAGIQPAPNVLAEIVATDPSLVLPLIPAMLLIVGPFEELLYRGVIQTRLRQSFAAPGAVLVQGVIFALIHIPAVWTPGTPLPSLLLTLTALFSGALIFGAIYEWTENLSVVALVHGLYNSVLLVLLYVGTRYGDELRELAQESTVFLLS